jgi:hypothetical protein
MRETRTAAKRDPDDLTGMLDLEIDERTSVQRNEQVEDEQPCSEHGCLHERRLPQHRVWRWSGVGIVCDNRGTARLRPSVQNDGSYRSKPGGHDSHQDSALHEETGMQTSARAGNGVRHSVFWDADLMMRRGSAG